MDILQGDKGICHFGPFLLDPIRRRLLRDGAVLKLPPKQFDTLLYLVENAGRVVDKDELMSAVWPGRIIEEGSLSQTVFLLRRVLQQADGDSYIVTAPGKGYRFAAPVERCSTGLDPLEAAVSAAMSAKSRNGYLSKVEPPEEPLVADCANPSAARHGAATREVHPIKAKHLLPSILHLAGLLLIIGLVAGTAALWGFRQTDLPVQPPPQASFLPAPHSIAVLAFANMSGDPSAARP